MHSSPSHCSPQPPPQPSTLSAVPPLPYTNPCSCPHPFPSRHPPAPALQPPPLSPPSAHHQQPHSGLHVRLQDGRACCSSESLRGDADMHAQATRCQAVCHATASTHVMQPRPAAARRDVRQLERRPAPGRSAHSVAAAHHVIRRPPARCCQGGRAGGGAEVCAVHSAGQAGRLLGSPAAPYASHAVHLWRQKVSNHGRQRNGGTLPGGELGGRGGGGGRT